MKITLSPLTSVQVQADAIAVPMVAGRGLPNEVADLDRALGGLIAEIISRNEHRGRLMEIMPVHLGGQIPSRRLLLYGLGSLRDMDGQRMRWAHHELIRVARSYGYRTVAMAKAPPVDESNLAAVVEGSIMGTWEQREGPRGAGGADPARLRPRQGARGRRRGAAWPGDQPDPRVGQPAAQRAHARLPGRGGSANRPPLRAGDRGAGSGRDPRRRLQPLAGGRPGLFGAAPADPDPAQGRGGRTDPGPGRQGHHLRLRRHLLEEARGHAPDEGRHGGRRRRAERVRGHRLPPPAP
ncbi:MAG: hypothetical protein E6J29_03355 [Chloroflexi bacterium]|nr:MAG: hypothetical protein E6J29_03355 [Chloroflexota bacterium]